MSARVRSDFFVAALIRRANGAGAFAVLRRRGADEAGAIFVRVERPDGTSALFGPASQSEIEDDGVRRFRRLHDAPWQSDVDNNERVAREMKFDPDLWLVDIDDREGRNFLEVE